MKKKKLFAVIISLFVVAISTVWGLSVHAAEVIPFNKTWKFIQQDVRNGEKAGFRDGQWRTLNLPHDWSIEGEYHRTAHGTDWQSGFLPAGIGWYRKHFTCPPEWKQKKVRIRFDGVYLNSKVWINGHLLGERPSGYISFEYDLTPYLKDGDNCISVRVDHSKPLSGRWYTGSGIYRNVWLLISDPTHIPGSGVWFRTEEVTPQSATYQVDVSVETGATVPATVCVALLDDRGTVASQAAAFSPGQSVYRLTGQIEQPCLWSPDRPAVYTLCCRLLRSDGAVIDEDRQPVGIRSVVFSPDSGLILNGRSVKLKGVCDHHTAGAVGAAVPSDVLHYRLQLLKKMGCNAIRTAHNPFGPDFYAMCDTMGIMVLNEGLDGWAKPKAPHDYGLYFNDWWQRDMTDFVKRDRNHPSVILWSIGNEEPEKKPEIQKALVDLFHSLDPGRPVTQGGTDPTRKMDADLEKDFRHIDVIGFNGNGEEPGAFENFKQRFPQRPAVATEVPHSNATRGVYRTKTQWRERDFPAPWEIEEADRWTPDEAHTFPIPDLSEEECFPEENPLYQSSYDNATVRIGVRKSWQRTSSFPWLAGEFRWGSFDYLGEAAWPFRCWSFGIIDIAAIPKDPYYLYQSLWTEHPMVHLLPHWTHPGKEGLKIPVVAYTNCDSVELFLNSRSLGMQAYTGEQLVWQVPYEAGALVAVAYKGGEAAASARQETAGEPYTTRSAVTRPILRAGSDEVARIEIDIVDTQQVMCPKADDELRFVIRGPLRLVAVDSGDPADLLNNRQPVRKAFRGKCVLLVAPGETDGIASVAIQSDTLKEKVITLIVAKNGGE
jgi:beta-galactosidase